MRSSASVLRIFAELNQAEVRADVLAWLEARIPAR